MSNFRIHCLTAEADLVSEETTSGIAFSNKQFYKCFNKDNKLTTD